METTWSTAFKKKSPVDLLQVIDDFDHNFGGHFCIQNATTLKFQLFIQLLLAHLFSSFLPEHLCYYGITLKLHNRSKKTDTREKH